MPHPYSPLQSIIWVRQSGERLRLCHSTRQPNAAGQMCPGTRGEQPRHPEGELPCKQGPSLTAQCLTRSGSISRTKSVTVRIAYTVNHGLIKLLSL